MSTYTQKVMDHFQNPRNIGEVENPDGVGEVGNPVCGDVMKITIKVTKKNNQEILEDIKFKTFGCLPPDEEVVLNPSGWGAICNVSKEDRVYNSDGKATFIVEMYKRNYKGKLLKIIPFISPFNAFKVTPNHPVLVIKRKWLLGARRSSNCCNWLRIPCRELIKTKPEFVKAKDLEPSDYLLYIYNKQVKDNKLFTKEFMRLLGYYLAEGYITADNSVVNFALNIQENKLITEIDKLILKLTDKKANYRIRGNVIEIYVCSRRLVRLLVQYAGKLAREKELDKEILNLPFRKQWEMIETYILGDGNTSRRRKNNTPAYRINTVSKKLAIQMQQILARGDIFASLRSFTRTDCYIDGRRLRNSLQYLISFKIKRNHKFAHHIKNYFLVPIKKIEKIAYSGPVYNFQVAFEPNTYLVKGFAVHNCAAAIAASSMITEMAIGKTLDEALKITRGNVSDELGGLPPIKEHCSNLAADALHKAIEDYKNKS